MTVSNSNLTNFTFLNVVEAFTLEQKEKEENPLESSDSEPSLLSQESYQRRKLLSQEKKQKNY